MNRIFQKTNSNKLFPSKAIARKVALPKNCPLLFWIHNQVGYRAGKSNCFYCSRDTLIRYGGRHLLIWRNPLFREGIHQNGVKWPYIYSKFRVFMAQDFRHTSLLIHVFVDKKCCSFKYFIELYFLSWLFAKIFFLSRLSLCQLFSVVHEHRMQSRYSKCCV